MSHGPEGFSSAEDAPQPETIRGLLRLVKEVTDGKPWKDFQGIAQVRSLQEQLTLTQTLKVSKFKYRPGGQRSTFPDAMVSLSDSDAIENEVHHKIFKEFAIRSVLNPDFIEATRKSLPNPDDKAALQKKLRESIKKGILEMKQGSATEEKLRGLISLLESVQRG